MKTLIVTNKVTGYDNPLFSRHKIKFVLILMFMMLLMRNSADLR